MNETITVTQDIDIEMIDNLIGLALKDGSRYWCSVGDDPEVKSVDDKNWAPVGIIECPDTYPDNEENTKHVLNLKSVRDGINLFARICPWHFSNMILKKDDIFTADAFLQCCVFGQEIASSGELKYG